VPHHRAASCVRPDRARFSSSNEDAGVDDRPAEAEDLPQRAERAEPPRLDEGLDVRELLLVIRGRALNGVRPIRRLKWGPHLTRRPFVRRAVFAADGRIPRGDLLLCSAISRAEIDS